MICTKCYNGWVTRIIKKSHNNSSYYKHEICKCCNGFYNKCEKCEKDFWIENALCGNNKFQTIEITEEVEI